MENTSASPTLKSLWKAIPAQPLDNRKWIACHLLENINDEEKEEYISKEKILAGIDAGLKDLKAGRTRPIEELFKELENEGYN